MSEHKVRICYQDTKGAGHMRWLEHSKALQILKRTRTDARAYNSDGRLIGESHMNSEGVRVWYIENFDR